MCDDFFHNESEQFTFTCSARHGKKKLQFPSRKWSFDLIMRNRRKLSNHFLVKPVKPYLSFSNFSFLRIWLFVYKRTNSVLTQKHISDRSVISSSKIPLSIKKAGEEWQKPKLALLSVPFTYIAAECYWGKILDPLKNNISPATPATAAPLERACSVSQLVLGRNSSRHSCFLKNKINMESALKFWLLIGWTTLTRARFLRARSS